MTRTQRILAAITAEIAKHQASVDADDHLQKLTVTVKLNDGGYPRAVWVERESMVDLTEARRLL